MEMELGFRSFIVFTRWYFYHLVCVSRIVDTVESMEEWMDEITRVTGLPRRFLLWDDKSKRIEMPLSVAEAIAEEVSAPVSMVEVLPTHERLEVTMVRLNST